MPELSFPRSDGGKTNVPANELISELISLSDSASITWRRKIGEKVAAALEYEKPRSYCLLSFPEHYALYRVNRAKSGSDLYLYGAPGKRFRSAAEFIPHAIWLFKDETLLSKNCECKYCHGSSQSRTTKPAAVTKGTTKKAAGGGKKGTSPKYVKDSDGEEVDEVENSEEDGSAEHMTDMQNAIQMAALQVITSFNSLQKPLNDCIRLLDTLTESVSASGSHKTEQPPVKKARRPKEMIEKQAAAAAAAAAAQKEKEKEKEEHQVESEEESDSEEGSGSEEESEDSEKSKEDKMKGMSAPVTSSKEKVMENPRINGKENTVKKSIAPTPSAKPKESETKVAPPAVAVIPASHPPRLDEESVTESSSEEEEESDEEGESSSEEDTPPAKPTSKGAVVLAAPAKIFPEVKKGQKRVAPEPEPVTPKPRSKRAKV